MDKNSILKSIEQLTSNSMFAMSLTSKELFHSNFWALLLRKYPKVFAPVFYPKYNLTDHVEVYREKYHFDLSLKIGDEIIIIENKCKSLPDKRQLEDYYKKLDSKNKHLVLVSYFKPQFGDLFNLEEYISYDILYERLSKQYNNTDASIFENNDNILIQEYLEFLRLLNEFKNNIALKDTDKIKDLWAVIRDDDVQQKLSVINFNKTFERNFIIKLTEKILEKFDYREFLDCITVDCGRDLKVYSDLLFYFPGAWDKDEARRQDLCYLGISLWGNEYRYYSGLHKAQCGITAPKNGKADKENKIAGYDYLSKNYSWLFEQEHCSPWNGYSYEKEMYLYKKLDISEFTVEELSKKAILDLELIYFYLEPIKDKLCQD